MQKTFEIVDVNVILSCDSFKYTFTNYEIIFPDNKRECINVFSKKNNKTLIETLKSGKYSKFYDQCINKYSKYLDEKLGLFLIELKRTNDNFYKLFLNKYGDEIYIKFKLMENEIINSKGLYFYLKNNELKYIGKTTDSIKKRINDGYGIIHPKNCYIDGQSTNCHINSLIAKNANEIRFYFCRFESDEKINILEKELINEYKPEWNIMLKRCYA